jgi:hypothetical protein
MKITNVQEIDIAEICIHNCKGFLDYWLGKRSGSRSPERSSLDPFIEKPQLAPYLFVYDVISGGRNFRNRIIGTKIMDLYGGDPTGYLITEFWFGGEIETVLRLLRKCVETGKPVAYEGAYHWQGRRFVEWQCVMTPLGTNNDQIEQVIGCVGLLSSPLRAK